MTNNKKQHTFCYQFEKTEHVKANKTAELASVAIHGYFIGVGESPMTETTIDGDGTLTVVYQNDKVLDTVLERICLGFADYYVSTEGQEF